jgi:hypothetical protein
MKTRRLWAAVISLAAVCVAPLVATAEAEAATVPSVNGVWYGWVGAGSKASATWTFYIVNRPGSSAITGTFGGPQGEAIHGTLSHATGEATWKAAYQSRDTIDFHVTFHFESTSTAKTNHPTYIGWYDYVDIATGASHPGGTTRGWRCSARTGAQGAAICQ